MTSRRHLFWSLWLSMLAFLVWAGQVAAQAADDVADGLEKATPLQNWQVIAGLVLPGILALVIQTGWSRSLQATVSMGAAMAVSVVAALLSDGSFVVPEVIVRGLETFAVAITMYYGLWKPTGIAPKIEAATSRTQ